MVFANDWTVTDNPADHSKFKDQPSFLRKLRTDLEERLADLFYGFTSGETTVGIKKLLLNNQASDPAAPTDAYVLFAKESYVFTISGITTMPTAGATYTNNTKTFTVLYASATQLYCSGTGAPAASGDLTKASGTGDATVAFSAASSTSELHVRHESAGIKIFTSLGKIIAGALTSLATIAADAGIIPIANLASGTPDGTQFIKDDGTLAVPETAGVGEVVQVVNTQTGAYALCTTVIPCDDTIPQITEGVEVMTLAITPKAVTNKLMIQVTVTASQEQTGYQVIAALFQDATANALKVGLKEDDYGNSAPTTITFTHFMEAGTISETTFRVRIGAAKGSVWFNGVAAARLFGGVIASSITITEIKA